MMICILCINPNAGRASQPLQTRGAKMKNTTFSIPNISCNHCVMAIKKELMEIDGVMEVTGDPAAKTITIQWEPPASPEGIMATLRDINYPAAA